MTAFLYPTEPGWIEDMRDGWMQSCLPYFSFSFLSFRPTTLPSPQFGSFWMYFYFSDARTEEHNLKRRIQYRARVTEYSEAGFANQNDVFVYEFDGEPRIWFKCHALEEVRSENCQLLCDSDFVHTQGVNLTSAIRNSIAPVRRVSHAKVLQRTSHENID
ncbi:hypothetical protein QUF90_02520 [Desulfococcaceae bacterium HSG9]|nr:hypothetical protein [Desulfococcaceae bacterium HSG9]